MNYRNQTFVTLLLLLTSLLSCKKDPPAKPQAIDLSQVRFLDFQLQEITYTHIAITHPQVSNGVETTPGEIRIRVPQGSAATLTPKGSNFTKGGFTITPQLGQAQALLNRVVIYTIASATDPSKRVHYAVTVTEEGDAADVEPALTSFRLEKALNPMLPADIEASRIIDGVGTMGKVFLFVPPGTPFNALRATVNYTGGGLYYLQDAAGIPENSTAVYPAAGLTIDYTYPKVFYAVVKSGNKVKTYNVIVDIKAPVLFDNATIALTVPQGTDHFLQATRFLNRGNHPISIISMQQSNQAPAGSNAVRGTGGTPSGGLKAGEKEDVFASINARTYPAGNYGVTVTFKPRLINHPEADDLLEGSSLRLTAGIQ